MMIWLAWTGCSRPDPEAERARAVQETSAKLRSCISEEKVEGKLRLALAEITVNPTETAVRIVAYAIDEAVDFDLPVYKLSAGRWLVNEKERVYLIDESCRQYKLKGRRSSSGQPIPLDGRIRLNPGESFEAILSFPHLSDQTRLGILSYGEWKLPFILWQRGQ